MSTNYSGSAINNSDEKSDCIISVKNLCKTYQKPQVEALRGLSLAVRPGICFGVLGPNGAGKSTLIEIMQGLRQPTVGEVELFGLSYKNNEYDIRKRIGGVLQQNGLYDRMKVSEALELFASFYDKPQGVAEVLTSLQLTSVASRYLVHLSGGQRQRVFLGAAIVGNPKILFLDEPTTGLDPASRSDFWNVIKALRNSGTTIVLTTHYMEEAEELCDELVIIDAGGMLEQGSPSEVIAKVASACKFGYFPEHPSLNDVFLVLTGRKLEC